MSLQLRFYEPSGQRETSVSQPRLGLGWTGRWEPRPAQHPEAVLVIVATPQGYGVEQARPEVAINDQPFRAPVALRPGDRIRYGNAGIEVLAALAPSAPQPSGPPSASGSQAASGSRSASGSASDSSLAPSLLGSTSRARSGLQAELPRVGDTVLRFELLEELGAGQFGAVFLARDLKLGRQVALKLLKRASERAEARFVREIQACARLEHPHVVAVYDGGELEGHLYMSMQLLRGRTLLDASKEPECSLADLVRWTIQSARGIAYANREGVLHRDLKPHNIMVTEEGAAVVVDFGMAGIADETSERLTRTGAALGTPAYMAPEVLFGGGKESSPRSEVFALASSLYHVLSGRLPRQEMREVPPPLASLVPDLPPWLGHVIGKAMAQRAQERYPDAEAFAQALAEGLARGGSPPPSRAPRFVGLAALGALLAAGVLAWAVARGEDPPQRAGSSAPAATPSAGPSQGASQAPGPPAEASPPPAASPAAQVDALLAEVRRGRDALAPSGALLSELDRARQAAGEDAALRARVDAARLALWLARAHRRELQTWLERGPQRSLEVARAQRALGRDEQALATLEALAEERVGAPAAAERGPAGSAQRQAAARWSLWLGQPADARALLEAEQPAPADAEAALMPALACARCGDPQAAREALARVDLPADRLDLAEARAWAEGSGPGQAAKPGLARFRAALAVQADEPGERGRRVAAELALAAGSHSEVDSLLSGLRAPGDLLQVARARDASQSASAPAAWRAAYAADPLGFWRATRELATAPRERAWRAVELSPPASEFPQQLPAHLRAASEGVPAAARAPLREALALAVRGEPWSALAEFLRRAEEAAPEDPTLLSLAARLRVGRDRYVDALATLARARRLGAPPAPLDLLEAELWLRRGQLQAASRRYQAVVEADPEGAAGGAAAAELSWLRRDPAAGIARAQRASEAHPSSAAAWLALGVSAIAAGQPDLALPALERCLELEGGLSARPLMFRAQLLAARAEPSAPWRALAPFEHALRTTRGCSPRILAARAALAQPEAAPWSLSALRAARSYEPRRPEVYVWTGLLRLREGAPQAEVDALWRRVLALDSAYRFPKSAQDAYRQRYGEALRLSGR